MVNLEVLSLRQVWLQRFYRQRLIAVIRVDDAELGWQMAKIAAAAGIELIEIAWNSQDAAHLIPQLGQALPDCQIGSGTTLTLSQLEAAITAGAKFVFMPHTDSNLIQAAVANGIAVIPGACTPSEIASAWQAGATAVKVFPIQSMGGVTYLKHLQAPLGEIPLIPTGGVTHSNAQEFLSAGALAVGIGSDLFPKTWVEARAWKPMEERLRQLCGQLRQEAPR